MLLRVFLPVGVDGLGQNFFRALGVLEGVGSRSLFSDDSDEHASSAWFPSSSVHFLNRGRSRSNRVMKRWQHEQMRFDLFDVLWSCNPKRRTCSYVHSPFLFFSKMLVVLQSSPCILKFFLQRRQKSFVVIFLFYFFQCACSWVLLTTTMRRLIYVTYYIALIGCRSIQLSDEAFYFLVRLKHAHNHSPMERSQTHILTRIVSLTMSG